MVKIKKRNQHGLKVIRRFDEDIWSILVNKKYSLHQTNKIKKQISPTKKKTQEYFHKKVFKPFKNGKNVLSHIYEACQNNFKYKRLLKNNKKIFFLIRRKKKFKYRIVTNELEYRKKMRTIKIRHYLNRLKLRRFYGNISLKKFKDIFKESALNSNFLGKSFICLLETRLDVILYRAKFFKSIFSARQYIHHKGIYIDGILVFKPNYKVKLFTIISIKNARSLYINMRNKFLQKKFFSNYPSYLEVNYKLGFIVLYKIPRVSEVPFPFFLNYKHIAHSFFK